MNELELKSKMQDVVLKHARNSGDYLPDYKYEKTINDLYELFKESVPAETLVRQGVVQPIQTPKV
jgi:hypothetical protein